MRLPVLRLHADERRVMRKHGLSRAPEYRAWQTMRLRCTDPAHPAWEDYGGRGISVCPEWLDSPQAFIDHIGPKPSPRHELDRIDNSRGYVPGNVRWATRRENCRNRRSNRWIEAFGERRTLVEWSERTGIEVGVLSKRLAAGRGAEEALTTPVRHRPHRLVVEVDGAAVEVAALERRQLVAARLRKGWDPAAAVATPPVRGRTYELEGEWLTLVQLSRRSGLARKTIRDRIERGLSAREAISVPPANQGPRRANVGTTQATEAA